MSARTPDSCAWANQSEERKVTSQIGRIAGLEDGAVQRMQIERLGVQDKPCLLDGVELPPLLSDGVLKRAELADQNPKGIASVFHVFLLVRLLGSRKN